MKKLAFGCAAVLTLAALGGTFYFLWAQEQTPEVIYDTGAPFVADIVDKTVATGSVVPRREIDVKPQISGIVAELFVEPGERVQEGDLLARVRIVPDMVNLANAENRVERAAIALADAETEHQRNRRLHREGLISEAAYRPFALALETARQEVKAAEDNLALIREGARKQADTASNTLVRATADGMVLEVPVEEGDSVIEANTFNDGTSIATIADMDEMIFEGRVDESEVGKIREGMELLLTVGAIEDEVFPATLEYIAPKGVEENGAIQFEIRAAVHLQEGVFLRANYSANADIVLARREDVLAVQESWLQFDEGSPFVEVEAAPQRFERREIETGLSDGLVIEVVAGLADDDRVKVATDPA